jgi:Protein of unknown function (DUF3383)
MSISANRYVSAIPNVLRTGGNPLSPNAVFVTENQSIPVGTVQGFPNVTAVENWFGPEAPESILANVYFSGYSQANSLPGILYFAQFNPGAIPGYLRGGALTGVTLTELQGLSGSLTIVIDGVSHVSEAINLASASSFTNAAALIQTGVQGGTPSTTATVTYDSLRNAFVITSSTTGASSSVVYPTTDSLATGLLLTSATGAIEAPGAAAGVPASIMNGIVEAQQNWVSFLTVTDPDAGAEPPTVKLEFAAWVTGASPAGQERFVYVAWDSDQAPAASDDATSSFGAIIEAGDYNGVHVVWDQTAGQKAAFVCGTTASLDTTETNGRITYDYKSQAGLVADVTSDTIAENLEANGYNFYGDAANSTNTWLFYQPGSVSGAWLWLDEYVDQILMNADFQTALIALLTSVKSIPYNNTGYALLRSACLPVIAKYLNFGAIQAGVELSQTQAQEVNTAAGVVIAPTLESLGWYLQILPASAQTRGNRTSPPMTFWYTDGGSVQQITLASIDVQ